MKRESQKRGWRSCCPPHTALPATEPARAPRPVLMPRRRLKHCPAQRHGARRFTVSTGHPGLHRADRGGHCQHPKTRTASPINHPTVSGTNLMEQKATGFVSTGHFFLAAKVIEWSLKGQCAEENALPSTSASTKPLSTSAHLCPSSHCPTGLTPAGPRPPILLPEAGTSSACPPSPVSHQLQRDKDEPAAHCFMVEGQKGIQSLQMVTERT